MIGLSRVNSIALFLAALSLLSYPAAAQEKIPLIPASKILSLETQLAEVQQAKSSARKKLAIRRVIREADALLEQNNAAPNRFQILAILFRGQQHLLGLSG